MKTLRVELGERSYPIHIGKQLLSRVPAFLAEAGVTGKQMLYVITDENVAPLYLEPLLQSLRESGYTVHSSVVAGGEQAKSFHVFERVMGEVIAAGLDRKSVILALGGGVVGDLSGFVAASFMRGIPFIQLPTTLLAHDSSVGGKVAINHKLGKNLIGAFHQPLAVIYDTDTLTTLPKREVAAGFAEVVKHGLISSEEFVAWLEEHAQALNQLEPELIATAIERGCAIKAQIVSEDETEQDTRALLNLGHTFGHAFEAIAAYSQLNHGEAISIGMGLAAELAEKMGLCEQGVSERTKRLLARYHLPTEWPDGFDPLDVLEAMRRDKKGVAGRFNLIVPRTIGKVEIVKNVDEALILQVMRESAGRRQK
ncbi:3-dehydroquinate synthase [Brevibacillus fluminis]|uniref:3-dehydroquinate synthase n=1 Tax=Brevibacillus fluminis TaxID=511487 RepID=UPI003F8A7E47